MTTRELVGAPSFDPRTGLASATVPESTDAAVADAVRVAEGAAAAVAAASPAERRAWLRAVAEGLEAHRAELVDLADAETALGPERLDGELTRLQGQLAFYGDVAVEGSYLGVTIDGATTGTPRIVRVNRPLGPVAVFGASNFPFAFGVLGNDTASALASGCPVVVKAHPAHPRLSVRLAEVAREALRGAGAPDGTLGLVVGMEAGAALVGAPGIAAVGFTGSQAGGLALRRLANERETVIPVYAEMGTVNPVVVTPSAVAEPGAVDRIADGFARAFTLGMGQFCTKPGLLFAPAGSGLAAATARALEALAPDPVMLTRGIAQAVSDGLAALTAAGGRILHRREGTTAGWAAPTAVLEADVDELARGSRLLEECFGPVALVVEYGDEAELSGALSRLQGCLVASLFAAGGADPDAARILGWLTPLAGRVAVGDWPTGTATVWAQHHGGPWPATSRPAATSVGAGALGRFVRPVAYQSVPDAWIGPEADPANPWGLPRRVDGVLQPG
ncbi:aldehyde dehydrogenase (NADP(+)) [Pseudonocardia ailaonensis]|uniref:Aldehyde dehydrogenase (NADP(+)) n=1 Tax=Pseudonocardia ailaonensis TaxID=367279 RepID=A0ABN2NMD2_9PSEU